MAAPVPINVFTHNLSLKKGLTKSINRSPPGFHTRALPVFALIFPPQMLAPILGKLQGSCGRIIRHQNAPRIMIGKQMNYKSSDP